MVWLIVGGLIMTILASVYFWLAREPEQESPELQHMPLSRLFPDLKEEDWKWLQSMGGFGDHPLYSVSDASPIIVPVSSLPRRDQVNILNLKEQTIAQQQEQLNLMRENNKRMQDAINSLRNLGR